MSHYVRTPRMVNPGLVPQPPPQVVYTNSNPSQYYNHGPATLQRGPSMGAYHPSQIYHVTPSERSRSRGHHRSSSKSRKHRRSRSTDRHGSRHHHRRRSATPSRSMSAHYPPETQYGTTRHHRHSYAAPDPRYRSSSRDPRRSVNYGRRDHHYVTHRRESIGERIKRFFGIGTHRVRFVNGHQVDHLGRPVYAM